MSKFASTSKKIKSVPTLAKLLKKKKQIVFTNGCFDLLHPGHIDYLERAKQLGSILVVALNSDASVRKIKGSKRPINPLKDRARVMAALECVDYVTSFSESTPLQTILKLKPHVIVKGGDWKPHQMVGAKEVRQWGGQAKSLSFLKGKSTTGLIQKIERL